MNLRQFLRIVPKAVKYWAAFVVVAMVLIGLVAGYKTAGQRAVLPTICEYGGCALVFGVFVGIWLLCAGFVFADARRRDMRPVLWVLVVTLFPHLLGFLLYFVMRYPIAVTCSNCGKGIAYSLRFCSWCGAAQSPPDSSKGPLAATDYVL